MLHGAAVITHASALPDSNGLRFDRGLHLISGRRTVRPAPGTTILDIAPAPAEHTAGVSPVHLTESRPLDRFRTLGAR